MLDVRHARQRQQRLVQLLEERQLDAVVVGIDKHVYYFTTFLSIWFHQSAAVIFADGRSWLTTASEPPQPPAADHVDSFTAQHLSTLRQEQPRLVAEQVIDVLQQKQAKRVGVDTSAVTTQLLMGFDGRCTCIDEDLWQMRRCKDPDELEVMKGAIRCTQAMHARARQIVEPGIGELEVFGELHKAAVLAGGEKLTGHLGNDYACGEPGGPPRQGRVAAAGELYILDLGPSWRGYRADNTRTLAVDRKPTPPQLETWQHVIDALGIFEQMARPGVRCRDIFDAVDDHFKRTRNTGMIHHLGHGVGLQPHEYPHLNPNWDDKLQAGEVVAVEPGQYGPELATGMRIENQYLITETGVENLVAAPLELA